LSSGGTAQLIYKEQELRITNLSAFGRLLITNSELEISLPLAVLNMMLPRSSENCFRSFVAFFIAFNIITLQESP
jgi:hypothetical protein